MSRRANLVTTGIAKSALIAWMVAAVFQGGLALAQVVKLTETTVFSNPLFLHFSDLQATSEASRVYSNLGVTFIGEAGSIPTVQIEALDHLLPGRSDWVLRNQPGIGSSANRALIIRFERPLKKVGFTLGNGTASTLAEISAFTAKGEFLGKVQHLGVETTRGINVHQTGPFVGLETSHPAGISSVVLDYGNEPAAEQIADVRVEFLSPLKFKVFLPQIVHGSTDSLLFQTIIQVQTVLSGVIADHPVRLRLFDQTGAPLRMTLGDVEGSEFNFNLGSTPTLRTFGSRQLQTGGGSDGVTVGYASLESDLPIIAQAIFRVLRSDGSLVSETGMPSGEGRITHVTTVDRDPQKTLDAAFAIVNVGDGEARLEFRLTDETGETASNNSQERFVLRVGEHRAFFFSELFNYFRTRQIRGQITIWSDKPIVVASLRTFGGLPTSAQALGSTQR